MKGDNIHPWFVDTADYESQRAQILRRVERSRKKRGGRVARALALLWPPLGGRNHRQ